MWGGREDTTCSYTSLLNGKLVFHAPESCCSAFSEPGVPSSQENSRESTGRGRGEPLEENRGVAIELACPHSRTWAATRYPEAIGTKVRRHNLVPRLNKRLLTLTAAIIIQSAKLPYFPSCMHACTSPDHLVQRGSCCMPCFLCAAKSCTQRVE